MITPDDRFYEDMGKAQSLAAQATAYRSLINRNAAPPTTQPPSPDTTAPSAPTSLAATAVSPKEIKLTWTAPPAADGVTGYRVSRGGGFVTFTPAGVSTTFVDSTLTPSSYYWYTVAAKDASGNWSAESSVSGATTTADTTTPPPVTEPPVVTPPAGALPYGLSSDPADYGPRKGLPARTAYSGPTRITTAGTVIENKNINGGISIAAANVVLRNCAISASGVDIAVNYGPNSPNLLIEDCIVDGSGGSGDCKVYDLIGGYSSGTVVRRCELKYGANAVEFGANGTVEGCYVHHIWQRPGTQDHADGIQTDGGGPYTVKYNYVALDKAPSGRWSQTSSIGMWADLGNLRDVLVENNVIGPHGGFLFYCGTVVRPYTATNVRFNNNVILRRPSGGEYGVWYSGSDGSNQGTHTGNVFADGTSAD